MSASSVGGLAIPPGASRINIGAVPGESLEFRDDLAAQPESGSDAGIALLDGGDHVRVFYELACEALARLVGRYLAGAVGLLVVASGFASVDSQRSGATEAESVDGAAGWRPEMAASIGDRCRQRQS